MHFVLVSAANANDLKLNKTFLYRAELRRKYVLSTYRAKDDVVITWFDVTSGVCQQEKMDKAGRRSKPTVLRRYKGVTRASYQPFFDSWRFKDGQPDVMSIVDVYRFVEDQSAKDPNTVYELSFFAHAWEEGPVFVDSNDDRLYKNASGMVVVITDDSRDPDDKDARLKDFEAVNRDVVKFRTAFHPDGAVRNWGCLHTPRDVELLKRLVRHKDYKRTGMKDSQTLTLDVDKELEELLKGRRLTIKKGKLTATFGELRSYIHGELTSCYTAKAAEGAGVKAYGAAPGTGSDIGTTGAAPQYIATSPSHNKQILEFHQEYLDVQFDAAWYAEFSPKTRPFTERP